MTLRPLGALHRRLWLPVVYWAVGALLLMAFSFPMVFMAVSSLKPDDQIFLDLKTMNAFLPTGDVSLDNYVGVFARVPVAQFLLNSAFTSALVVGLGLVVNSLAGFALTRVRWRGQTVVLGLLIATLIVPFETIAIPMVFLVSRLPWFSIDSAGLQFQEGLMNTYAVQILPFVANAFSIFLFAQYFKSIPRELDEAAMVDGASWWRVYRTIVMPLAGPVVATAAILTFLPVWNAYLWPIMTVQKEDLRPIQVGLQYFFQENVEWGQIMAYTTIITLPVLVMFLLFQRAFVASIASSGVKG
ncbi:MAG: carbohydrate ABC transporter permease [Microcella sp.]|uniref:carbohydrate ABC transporter permease n=1 Tax=Microcella sp. TaxID=1913979 RepID=UPI00271D0E6B|nr:carbohydrate ABC transporter permease [Microcella sp.]MDO8336948.1 carbohydrate ABC transporter permease [Microcella sp.]